MTSIRDVGRRYPNLCLKKAEVSMRSRAGKLSQALANDLNNKLREDLERMKKIHLHRGIGHYWGVCVRGQDTKTTGRYGRTVELTATIECRGAYSESDSQLGPK